MPNGLVRHKSDFPFQVCTPLRDQILRKVGATEAGDKPDRWGCPKVRGSTFQGLCGPLKSEQVAAQSNFPISAEPKQLRKFLARVAPNSVD